MAAVTVLECAGVTVRFGATVALDDCTMHVGPGECVALLGPSGSGKTTLLHTAAGFVAPDSGSVAIAGRIVAGNGRMEPPERRRVGLVFQSYALWPHLTALETVIYPMARRGMRRSEAERDARALLDAVGMAALADRYPTQLSGGQQQRVGLARALAAAPDLFLFDEPTANLDAALKATFQEEIARQQRARGTGALYVTHDPLEAFAVADRVIVLRDGRLVQDAAPTAIYARPADVWVARLTGGVSVLPAVFLSAAADGDSHAVRLQLGPHTVVARMDRDSATAATAPRFAPDDRVQALLRPEWLRLVDGDEEGIAARVTACRFGGPHTDYLLDSAAGSVVARVAGSPTHAVGDAVRWRPERVWLLPPEADAPPR